MRPEGTTTSIVLFLIIFAVMAADMWGDRATGASGLHLLAEATVLVLSAVGSLLVLRRFRALREEAARLGSRLQAARADAERWRAEAQGALRGLGEAMAGQFQQWGLTPAEQEVALLLVKGLSLKEAAQVRGTSERTVRQQALAVYRKAGVGGRAELSAFFLEDLLLPLQSAPVARPAVPSSQ